MAAAAAAVAEWGGLRAPWALRLGLLVLITVTALTVPGNPVLDLNNRQYRAPGTILAHVGALLFLVGLLPSAPRGLAAIAALSPPRRLALLGAATVAPLAVLGLISLGWPAYVRALTREWGLVEPAEATLYLTAAWIAWRHARLLGPRAPDSRCYRFVAFVCAMLALEEMDWLGIPGPLIGRVGASNVYLGSSHDLLKVAWHYHWFAIPLAISALLVLAMVWYRGDLTVGFARREILDPTTLPLYGALVAQAVAQTLDVDDTLLGARHPFSRYPLEEPLELLSELLLVSGLVLKYSRDWRRAGRPRV
ncbi:MAG: hypothetical protein ACREKJ_03440 [Candidatus Rokuibacteriota bacterium]